MTREKRVLVELERPSGGSFTYIVPTSVRVGQRVVVDFGDQYPKRYNGRIVANGSDYDGPAKHAIGLAFPEVKS